MYLIDHDGSQNISQHVISQSKKEKSTDYVLSWKSKEVYTSKIKALYTAFLDSIKDFGYRIGIKFDKDPLAIEQKNIQRNLQMLTLSMSQMPGKEFLLAISNLKIAWCE